jgi:hypothetical protein
VSVNFAAPADLDYETVKRAAGKIDRNWPASLFVSAAAASAAGDGSVVAMDADGTADRERESKSDRETEREIKQTEERESKDAESKGKAADHNTPQPRKRKSAREINSDRLNAQTTARALARFQPLQQILDAVNKTAAPSELETKIIESLSSTKSLADTLNNLLILEQNIKSVQLQEAQLKLEKLRSEMPQAARV